MGKSGEPMSQYLRDILQEKNKLNTYRLGKWATPETRKKISEGMTKYWIKRKQQ